MWLIQIGYLAVIDLAKPWGEWQPAQVTLEATRGLAEQAAGRAVWQVWQRAAMAARGRGAWLP